MEWFRRFMRIGIPGCIQEVALIFGGFGLFYVLSNTAQPAINQAAWGIGWRVEELLVLTPMFAFKTAISIIVGQNLGADQIERAELSTWKIVGAGFGINLLIAALLWFYAANIASVMTTDAVVITALAGYFHIVAWTEPFFGSWFILCGAMQGAGYTRLPMIVTIICLGLLRVLGAWYLTSGANFGANGTWIAMAFTSILAGVVMSIVFKLERWKYHPV